MIEKALADVKKLLIGVLLLLAIVSILLFSAILFHFNPSIFELAKHTEREWELKHLDDLPGSERSELIKYGFQIINNTSSVIGPRNPDSLMRYAGNNLSCTNCHLNAGRKIGAVSFVGTANRFPQFRGRENKIGTLADRINGCMQRSMNGEIMPTASREMKAIIEYIKWLSEDVPDDIEKLYKGFVQIEIPEIEANPIQGEILFKEKCIVCHQEEGKGMLNSTGTYLYPPLAGPDSYNDGAGMTRVITAANFIKSNMPLGATYDMPQVKDEEAYHLAAYINSLKRPEISSKEEDFPDKKLKPVSTPYGPWADNFSSDQHKYGPFQPIIKYYEETYNIIKTK